MNTNTEPLLVAKGPSTLTRAKFGPGMLLQHDDLEQLNVYTRALNRLMFSSLFGCGVVCGLVVGGKMGRGKLTVTVDAGLALDCQGDPIYVPTPQSLELDGECGVIIPERVWVVLCAATKGCVPRTPMCGPDEDESTTVPTRERDYFEIRIFGTRPGCTCSCRAPSADQAKPALTNNDCKCVDPEHKCYVDHYAGKCGCDCDDCAGCDCDCVLLARLDRPSHGDQTVWTSDHRVRRFVRPVLMRDPRVWIETEARQKEDRKDDQPEDHQDAAAGAQRLFEAADAEVRSGIRGGRRVTSTRQRAETDILKHTRGRDYG